MNYLVKFAYDTSILNWREAQSAAEKFSTLAAGAGRVRGTLKECEFYMSEHEKFIEEYQGLGRDALSVERIEL